MGRRMMGVVGGVCDGGGDEGRGRSTGEGAGGG